MENSLKKIDKKDACPNCLRPLTQCFCQKVESCGNRIKVLILQHPQEQYKLLNSAMLAHRILKGSILKVGLSWRNFRQALGEEADPKTWGVLFLKPGNNSAKVIDCIDPKKRPLSTLPALNGIVVIDGSWKQAKALWWRNPWLLKLNRITLNPQHPSLRTQTKKEGLSTIESLALALENFNENASVRLLLLSQYEELIIKPNSVFKY
ncbi:MAG TPA: DTW domain-containing protein [Fibrobacteres bacterium]|jgi:DTW domain-containing protein|nr:DTW domain-containing protein [Fibrobacterota bacterium]